MNGIHSLINRSDAIKRQRLHQLHYMTYIARTRLMMLVSEIRSRIEY